MMTRNVVVTGGAGFIGSNLVIQLLRDGHHVTVLDSLSREGSEHNLAWLQEQPFCGSLQFFQGDVRDFDAVQIAIAEADVIYHLAAQVAVTASIDDPRRDYEINATGTLNVLEAARLSGHNPVIVFTSTNKVYGGIEDGQVTETETRYRLSGLPEGISESRALDFHSPYGCSKGAADQYVRDYARIYGLPTVVFRMSCIYGPRQFGNEDQGWVAHFLISTLMNRPIAIYGSGKQVRDVLYVDDLVRALRVAADRIDATRGQVFNIGGGPENTLSVWHEFSGLLAQLKGDEIPVSFGSWRPGDQPCYVSDIRKAERYMGWKPQVDTNTGIHLLWDWLSSNRELFLSSELRPVHTASA